MSGPASALLAGDINLTKDWVSFVLGPLADDDLETARLRETLEVFLTIGSNYTMAADKLHLHPNTIKYRIHNAQDRLLVTTNDGRIDVALARSFCAVDLAPLCSPTTAPNFRVVVRRYTGGRFALG